MAIKNIILDFGGVLYEIAPQRTINGFKELSDFDFNAGADSIKNSIPEFSLFEEGKISVNDFGQSVCKKFSMEYNEDIFNEIWLRTLVRPYDEALNVIKDLKWLFKLALLSNTDELHYGKFSAECAEMFSIFDGLFFSFIIGERKPHTEIFKLVLNKMDFNPSETLFIDDSVENIKAASLLGMHTLHFDSTQRLSDLLHSVNIISQNN